MAHRVATPFVVLGVLMALTGLGRFAAQPAGPGGFAPRRARSNGPLPEKSGILRSYSGADYQIYLMADTGDQVPGQRDPRDTFVQIAQLQTLTVSSARSKHPVRRLGESEATAYSSGARTIAGSMIFATAAEDALTRLYSYSKKEIRHNSDGRFFADQLPELYVFIEAGNEYGDQASAALIGVEITNFGTTMSVDDMYTETVYTYVARYYLPLMEDKELRQRLEEMRTASPTRLGEHMVDMGNAPSKEVEQLAQYHRWTVDMAMQFGDKPELLSLMSRTFLLSLGR